MEVFFHRLWRLCPWMPVQASGSFLGMKWHRCEWLHLEITRDFMSLASHFSTSESIQTTVVRGASLLNSSRQILEGYKPLQDCSEKAKRKPAPTYSLQHCIRDTLTYSKLLSKDCFLSQRRAVPPPVPKLVLALIDSHLCPFPDHNDGIRAALADRSLPRGQAWDFVADDISS